MKLRKKLLCFNRNFSYLSGQRGQALVEYVLLLAVVALISYGFVAFMNRGIGKYWENAVNVIIHDGPGNKTAIIE